MAPTHLIARASSGRPHSPPARPRDEYTKAPRPRRRARIQPLAVMVEAKHALVAEPAVLRRREHVDLAEVAAARVLADRRRPQRQRLATPGEAIRCRRRRGGDAGVAGVDGRGDPSAEEGRRRGGRVHRPDSPARRLAGKQRQQQPVEVEEDDREQGPGQALQRMQRIVEAVLAHSRNAASRQDHLCSIAPPCFATVGSCDLPQYQLVPQYRSAVPTVPCTSWYKLVAPADTYGTAVELLIVTYRNLCLLYGSRDTSDLIYHHHDCQCPVR